MKRPRAAPGTPAFKITVRRCISVPGVSNPDFEVMPCEQDFADTRDEAAVVASRLQDQYPTGLVEARKQTAVKHGGTYKWKYDDINKCLRPTGTTDKVLAGVLPYGNVSTLTEEGVHRVEGQPGACGGEARQEDGPKRN